MTEIVVNGGQRDRLTLQGRLLVLPNRQGAAFLGENLLHQRTYIDALSGKDAGRIQAYTHGCSLFLNKPALRARPNGSRADTPRSDPNIPVHLGFIFRKNDD